MARSAAFIRTVSWCVLTCASALRDSCLFSGIHERGNLPFGDWVLGRTRSPTLSTCTLFRYYSYCTCILSLSLGAHRARTPVPRAAGAASNGPRNPRASRAGAVGLRLRPRLLPAALFAAARLSAHTRVDSYFTCTVNNLHDSASCNRNKHTQHNEKVS